VSERVVEVAEAMVAVVGGGDGGGGEKSEKGSEEKSKSKNDKIADAQIQRKTFFILSAGL